jgi:hypothetical protein
LGSRLAVHHQCFRSPEATRHAASLFLRWNPDVPYYLWSDAGDDFSELARSLNINYQRSEINVGHSRYNQEQLYELLSRIRQTANSSGADLILWMEDDVITRKQLKIASDVQSTCLSTTHKIWPACHDLLRQKYHVEPNVPSWGMAGGSLLNGRLFRERWPLIHEFASVDYPHLLKTCGPEVAYADVLMQMIHMIAEVPCEIGKYVVDHCERPFPGIPLLRNIRKFHYNRKPLVHGIKTYY